MENKKNSLEYVCDFFVQEFGIKNIKQTGISYDGLFFKINGMELFYCIKTCSVFRLSDDGIYSDNISILINNKLLAYMIEHEGSPFEDMPSLNRLLQGME